MKSKRLNNDIKYLLSVIYTIIVFNEKTSVNNQYNLFRIALFLIQFYFLKNLNS